MILDHVEMLELPDELALRHNNEIYTLQNLTVGLAYLNSQVVRVEDAILGQAKGNVRLMVTGNIPDISPETRALVTCAFHWYAVSACNYVWLVGWLAQQGNRTLPKPQKYAAKVIPAVVEYRHKVGAHFSTLEPRDDSAADIAATFLFPLTLTEKGFTVGGLNVTLRQSGKLERAKHDIHWSLTETHRELTKRYWPRPQA